jgi:hypothetical protein
MMERWASVKISAGADSDVADVLLPDFAGVILEASSRQALAHGALPSSQVDSPFPAG